MSDSSDDSLAALPPSRLREMVAELGDLFNGENNFSLAAVYRAGLGGMRRTSIRSVYWRMFTGLLTPPADGAPCSVEHILPLWKDELAAKRELYHTLHKKHEVKTKSAQVDDDDEETLAIDNPLSDHQDNSWNKVFEHSKLEREIQKDLERLSSEDTTFLEDTAVRQSMMRVLRIYSLETPDPGYRQGMHDLLSAFAFHAYTDRHCATSAPQTHKREMSAAMRELVSLVIPTRPADVEADMYYMYFWLMNDPATNLKAWYRVMPGGGGRRAENDSPIIKLCNCLQASILPKHDAALARHLDDIGIEASLYALRWFRVWFIREFDLVGSAPLWDAVLTEAAMKRWGKSGSPKAAASPKLHTAAPDASCPLSDGLMPLIGTAMLTYLSQDLQTRDFNLCLTRLMKYPPVEDVRVFVERAVGWQGGGLAAYLPAPEPEVQVESGARPVQNLSLSTASSTPNNSVAAAAPVAPAPTPAPAAPQHYVPLFGIGKKKKPAPRPVGVPPPQPTTGAGGQSEYRKQLVEVINNEHALADRLDSIISIFQTQWFDKSEKNAEQQAAQEEKILLAIAELKQVKDTLAGSIIPSPANAHLQVQPAPPRLTPIPSLSGR